MQYTDVSAKPAAGGVDSYSARAKISEDYVEDALNMDVDASGRWSKRPGYETNNGWLPLRARRFIQDGTSIRVHFDSSQIINLATVELGPVIMYGKLPQLDTYGTSSYSDEFNVVYFESFNLINRDTLSVGTHTLEKPAADTGVTSKYVYVGLAQALSQGSASNEILTPSLVEIDTSSFDITVEYTITAQSSGYLYYKEKEAETGVTYIETWPVGMVTCQIESATHGLSHTRMSVKVFEEAGGVATEIIPMQVFITSDGQVNIEIQNAITGYVILSTVPVENYYSAPATAGVNTIIIPSPPSELCFYYIYYYDQLSGSRYQAMPSLIAYDADTNTTAITYELAVGSETVEVYYEEGVSIANIIELIDPAGSATTDTTEGSFVVWGMGHEGIYTPASVRGGHVHHLDNYKSVGEQRLVAGVNGCLYAQTAFADADSAYLMDTKYTSLNGRVDGEQILGPLFTTSDEDRTRGNVIDASIEDNTALCTDVTYISAGVTQVTLAFTAKTGTIATASSADDLITISGMSDTRNNGVFGIRSVISEDAISAVIEIDNESAFDTTIEEAGCLGRAGVFTDTLAFTVYERFIPGDFLYAEGIAEYEMSATVDATTVMLKGITEATTFSSNLLVTGRRTGRVIPLRLNDSTLSVENLVRGDSLDFSGVAQKPVIKNVVTGADVIVSATTVDGVTTFDLQAARTLNEGQYITIFGDYSDAYNGEWQIDTAPSTIQITVLTPNLPDAYIPAMRLLGKCVEIDQSLEWEDSFESSAITPVGRWLPIEAPSRGDSLVVTDTSALLFASNSYSNQPNVSSTVVSDSMFFANGDDSVKKYDGVSVMQAGLTRTIPSAFMSFDNTVPSLKKGFEIAYTAASVAGKSFTIGVDAFNVGDRIYDDTTEAIFVVTDKHQDIANDTWKIVVAGDTTGLTGTGTLTLVKRLRYYVRFNLIDRNNNIISSNAANSSDMYFDLVEDGRVRIKTSYYYPQGFQDYTRLEVELYKTLSNSPAPFYLTKRLAVDMNYSGTTSLEFIDDNDDEFLTELDVVSSALLQTEIGKNWQPAYRAKSITTLDNRLIAANLKGWPRFDVTLKPKGVSLTSTNLNGLKFLFKKDNTDASALSNFTDRQAFEFRNTGAVTCSITTGVVTAAAHGLSTGNWIYLFYNAAGVNKNFGNSGWFQIEVINANTFSLLGWGHDITATTSPDRFVTATAKTDIPVWIGVDGNYNQVNGNSTGSVELVAARRLADAVNFTMSYSQYLDKAEHGVFEPWLTAYAGSDYNIGQIVVESQLSLTTTPEMVVGTIPASLSLFVNNLARDSAEQIGASTALYPSRVSLSYRNYPELFDNLDGERSTSDSVVDINPADGQEIIKIVPFFAESTTGIAALDQTIIVFKEASVYALDTATREYKRIHSRGAVAPFSITPVGTCIMFATLGGIYRVTRQLTVQNVGKMMLGKWKADVAKDALSYACATHWEHERQYKLSLPATGQTVNSLCFVMHYDREEEGLPPAWTPYDSIPATMWANQGAGSFFGSTEGIVYMVRQYNLPIDYRDDVSAIASSVTFRPEDFGLPGIRKTVPAAVVQLETDIDVNNIVVKSATNLSRTFQEMASIDIDAATSPGIKCSLDDKRGTHVQIKIEHAEIDEEFSVVGINYQVGRMNIAGVSQAKEYTR